MASEPAWCDNLMARASVGDRRAFGELAAGVQDELFRFALAQGLAWPDAAEATQETLLRAYRGRRGYRRDGRAKPWLFGIAMNVVRESRRRRGGTVLGLDPAVLESASAPERPVDDEPRRKALARALEALPPRQREAIACRFLGRMSVRDTAAAMGCAEGTVKATVSAAMENLRKTLRVYEDDG